MRKICLMGHTNCSQRTGILHRNEQRPGDRRSVIAVALHRKILCVVIELQRDRTNQLHVAGVGHVAPDATYPGVEGFKAPELVRQGSQLRELGPLKRQLPHVQQRFEGPLPAPPDDEG